MKTKKIQWNFTVPVVLLVVLALLVSATLALFTQSVDGTRQFRLSNFTSSVRVYFLNNNGGAQTSATTTRIGDSIPFPVAINEYTNGERNTNFIGDLHVDVSYSGSGVGLVRVKVTEEWSKEATVGANTVRTVYPYSINVAYQIPWPYVLSTESDPTPVNQSKWYDNRANDYCFYFATPINGSSMQIPLISGVDTERFDFGVITDDTRLTIVVKADVVQVNRYPQYWGMTSLPWSRSGDPANTLTEVATLQ